VEVHRKQLTLNQVRLRRLAQADGDVGLAHGEIEFLFGGEQRDVHFGIKVNELTEPWREPMHAHTRRRGHAQIAVRPLAAVGQLRARGFQIHEHIVRGAIEQIALLGQDQAARMPMKQRDGKLLFECAHLPRHR
jgi:hypothetical protein